MPNSINWFQQAAEKGNTSAMCALGRAYAKGSGADRDETKAVEWYHKAMQAGDPQGAYLLSRMYFSQGKYADTLRYLRVAADANYEPAYFQLGYMYHTGSGVIRDADQAIYWFELSAQSGNKDAMYNLGIIMAPPSIEVTVRKPLSIPRRVTYAATAVLACISLISLAIWGCSSNKLEMPPTVIESPSGPQPGLDESRISTTQVSTRLQDINVRINKNSADIGNTAADMADRVTEGREKTPEIAKNDLYPIWSALSTNIGRLWAIKGENDRVAEQVKAQKDQIDNLTRQLDEAKKADEAEKAFWMQREEDHKTVLEIKDGEIDGLKTEINELTDIMRESSRGRYRWLVTSAIIGIGICIALSFFAKGSLGIAGAVGFGVILIITIAISEFTAFMNDIRWMFPWMVGTVFTLLLAYIIWRTLQHRRAIKDMVQGFETLKQLLPVPKRLKYFGYHAELGVFEDRFSDSTKDLVAYYRGYVKRAIPIDPQEEPHPDDNVIVTDDPTTAAQ